ncbi:hypothetical protein ZWY2020_059316 [Hordeum vulgare]|nr:hypothetical protein ZWY2020_059316 [Hordeum vulgare]
MVLKILTSNFTFIAPNFSNKKNASSKQLFLQSPLRIIEYMEMLTVVPLSIISVNIFCPDEVLPARNNP